jgi:hypothetical protein
MPAAVQRKLAELGNQSWATLEEMWKGMGGHLLA